MGLLFNGTTQYISVASCPVTAVPLTISCWINQPVLTTNTVYLNLGSNIVSDFSTFQLVYDTPATTLEISNNTSVIDLTPQSTLNTVINTTYHICAVFTTTTNRTIYVNGGNSTNNTTSCVPTAASLNTTVIGAQMNGGTIGSFINSNIYFPAIWNVALSAADVTSLSLGISPRKIQPSHLVRYARLTGHNSPEPDMMNSTGFTVTAAPVQAANIRMYFP